MRPPRARKKPTGATCEPAEDKVTGFVFKVQANMDPNHRDRIAFVRLCSGQFKRGMKMFHVRSGKPMAVNNAGAVPCARARTGRGRCAGDIIGIPNHGNLRIGDTLTEGEKLRYVGVPSFAPELLQRVHIGDPLKSKQMSRARAFRRGRRIAGVQAVDRLRLDRRRRRPLAIRSAGGAHRGRIRLARQV